MLKIKSFLLIFTVCMSLPSFAQSGQDIRRLHQLTYEKCLGEAQIKEKEVTKINNYIISCMSKNGFLTKEEYEKQRQLQNSSDINSNNSLSFEEFLKKRINNSAVCSQQYSTEQEILNCIKNLAL